MDKSERATSEGNEKLTASRSRELIRIWDRLVENESFPQVDKWLSEHFRANSKYGSKDRKWYSDCIFCCIRYASLAILLQNILQAKFTSHPPIHADANFADSNLLGDLEKELLLAAEREEWSCNKKDLGEFYQALRKADPVLIVAFSHMLAGITDVAQTLPLTPQKKYLVDKLFHALSTLAKKLLNEGNNRKLTNPEWIILLNFHGVPSWYHSVFLRRVDKQKWQFNTIRDFLTLQNSRPPLWLRLNYPKDLKSYEQLNKELKSQDFLLQRHSKSAVVATGAKGIYATQSYKNGLFEIQDLASQLIGSQVENLPGDFVWDTCAGGGGKTMQIASRAENKGVVYATDVRGYKLEEVKKRARRAGFFNIRCMPWDGKALPDFPKEVVMRSGFDWVLVDAPCSSSGTWRRNPDAKYRTFLDNFKNLAELQLNILKLTASGVRNGGKLVYSTCSWLVEENEDVVNQFLVEHPEFELLACNLFGAPELDSDTMFAAVLQKRKL